MDNAENILKLLLESTPIVLALVVLAAVLITLLYIMIKAVVPALRELVQISEVQRASWKTLIDEQNRMHSRISEELEERVTELESEVEKLRKEDEAKSARIEELECEIEKLRQEDKRKAERIAELEEELKQVRSERDDLRQRIKTLEKVTKEQQDKELSRVEKQGGIQPTEEKKSE